jgi:hypothetical protein
VAPFLKEAGQTACTSATFRKLSDAQETKLERFPELADVMGSKLPPAPRDAQLSRRMILSRETSQTDLSCFCSLPPRKEHPGPTEAQSGRDRLVGVDLDRMKSHRDRRAELRSSRWRRMDDTEGVEMNLDKTRFLGTQRTRELGHRNL